MLSQKNDLIINKNNITSNRSLKNRDLRKKMFDFNIKKYEKD